MTVYAKWGGVPQKPLRPIQGHRCLRDLGKSGVVKGVGVRTRDSIRTILGTAILEFGDEWLRGYSLRGNRIWRVSLLFVFFSLRFWQVWLFRGPAGLYENF